MMGWHSVGCIKPGSPPRCTSHARFIFINPVRNETPLGATRQADRGRKSKTQMAQVRDKLLGLPVEGGDQGLGCMGPFSRG